MTPLVARRSQRGYLLEIPLLLLALVAALAFLLPRLSVPGQKVLLAFATVPTLFCFYYGVVAPGWTAGAGLRGGRAWRLGVFLGCAAVTVAAVAAFILRH
jgi:hypothetical protein